MPLNPALIADTAADLLACACSAMVDGARWMPECCDPTFGHARAFIAEGDVAWDTCACECGQLSVRLTNMFETDTLGSRQIGPDPQGLRTVVAEWEILRLRCAANIPDGQSAPTAAALTASGAGLLTDLWTLWTGVRCCFASWHTVPVEPRTGWITNAGEVPPQGGCVGVRLIVQTGMGPSCDCRPFVPPPMP